MISCYVRGIGLIAPGLPDWPTSVPVLAGASAYQSGQALPALNTTLLPANERRRLTPASKLALAVAEAAMRDANTDQDLASVFASSSGDNDIVDNICNALLLPQHPVSPTHFHNSVHNAPAGYWSIATHCKAASISLSAGEASFAAGLLEAAMIVNTESDAVLLVAYEQPAPEPLASAQPFTAPFALALILAANNNNNGAYANLQLSLDSAQQEQEQEHYLQNSELERLRRDNPAARSLPLLQLLAQTTVSRPAHNTSVSLFYPAGRRLIVNVC